MNDLSKAFKEMYTEERMRRMPHYNHRTDEFEEIDILADLNRCELRADLLTEKKSVRESLRQLPTPQAVLSQVLQSPVWEQVGTVLKVAAIALLLVVLLPLIALWSLIVILCQSTYK